LLGLFNATRIVCFASFQIGCSPELRGGVDEPPLGRVIAIPAASPVVFSRSLVVLPPPSDLDKPMVWSEDFLGPASGRVSRLDGALLTYLQAGRFDLGRHVAAALPIRAVPAGWEGAAPAGGDEAPPPVLGAYRVGLQSVGLTIEAKAAGFVQLAHPFFPGNEVRINGNRVEPGEGTLGLMILPLKPGLNTIEIAPTITPIRRLSVAISLAALLLALGLCAAVALRSRAAAPRLRPTPERAP
jgi:hypothetical protein